MGYFITTTSLPVSTISAAPASNTPVVPQLVQAVGSTTNDNNGITGNNFVINLPNLTLAGNCLVLKIAYPFGAARTVSISDSTGDTWPSAAATVGTASSGNMNVKMYALPNSSAGLHKLTITLDAEVKPFQYTLEEWYNIAGAAPVDGTQGAANSTGPNVSAGSYTPLTNNDANGGHLILTYAISNDTVGTLVATEASAMSATNGAKLIHADNSCTIPSVSSYSIQSTNGAINPGFSITQSSATNFVCASMALKVASFGQQRPAGIRIIRLLHCTCPAPKTGNNLFLFPSDGNLLVATMAAGSDLNVVNSVSDTVNAGNYAVRAQVAGASQVFDMVNAASSNSLGLNVNLNAGETQFSIHLWDIVGAAAAPFDKATSVTGGAAPSTGTVCNDLPDHTPNTASAALTIDQTGFGTASQGSMAAGSPSGAIFDTVSYTTSAPLFDQDRMDNADPFAHVYHTSNALQAWNFNMTAQSHGSTIFATAVTYKAA